MAGESSRTKIAARCVSSAAPASITLAGSTLVLDGEVAIFDEQLRSRFDWLREPDRAAVASPPVYMAFDLLYRDGRDLTARPLAQRRIRLEDVVSGSELVFPVRRLAPGRSGCVEFKSRSGDEISRAARDAERR
jgi:ATP-dependent DNA ligase